MKRYSRFNLDVGYRLVIGDGAAFPVNGRTSPMGMNATMPMIVEPGSNFVYDDQITFGLGASFRLGDAPLDLVAELYGNYIMTGYNTDSDFYEEGALNLEALLGLGDAEITDLHAAVHGD